MEQQIRNENFREIEFKKSMFNVKMFSLMKKQLFSLVMMLAIVVLASTSAWAQPNGTATNPFWHVNNSTHTLTVTANASSSFSWVASDPTALSSFTGDNTNSATITWDEDAAGIYYFDVTETDNTNACEQTIRRVYIGVLAFDIYAYFSDNAGGDIEGTGAMAGCSEGTVANYGDIGPGDAFSQVVNIESSGTAGDLSTQTGTSPRSVRYIALDLTWATPSTGTFTAPTVGSIQFDYALTLTDAEGTFHTFNGVAASTGNTFVDGDGTSPWVIPIEYDVEWGAADVTTAVTVTNCTLYSLAGGSTTPLTVRLGTELNTNEAANGGTDPDQNTTDVQTIWSAPATSVITVN
jgi:hypothetical protein